MCLSDINKKAEKPSTIIGYRAAYHNDLGGYSPCHCYHSGGFKIGKEATATGNKERAGFHVFFTKEAATTYKNNGNGNCVIKVQCRDIWHIGRHRTSPYKDARAFTCGKMTVLEQVIPVPPKPKWHRYDQISTDSNDVVISAKKPRGKNHKTKRLIAGAAAYIASDSYMIYREKGEFKLVPKHHCWIFV